MDHFVIVKSKRPILRFWEVPSFDDGVSWTIFVDNRKPNYVHPMVRKVIGIKYAHRNSYDDLKDMAEETASNKHIKVQEHYLKPEEFARLEISRPFTFSLVSQHLMGLDGSTFCLQSWTDSDSLVLEWWEAGPNEWHEIVQWASQTRQFLSDLLDAQEKAFKDINQQFDAGTPNMA